MANLPKPDLYAFPLHVKIDEPLPNGDRSITYWSTPGMTMRDYFAAAVLTGLMADHTQRGDADEFAASAYMFADAMLKARHG